MKRGEVMKSQTLVDKMLAEKKEVLLILDEFWILPQDSELYRLFSIAHARYLLSGSYAYRRQMLHWLKRIKCVTQISRFDRHDAAD